MKNILKFVAHYFFILLCFTLIGIFGYFLYDCCFRLVAGVKFSFNKFALVKGSVIGLELAFLFSGVFMCSYRIRTDKRKISLFITYICLGIFTWFLAFPGILYLDNKYCNFETVRPPISKDYFRGSSFSENDKKINYFLTDEVNSGVKVISVDKKDFSAKDFEISQKNVDEVLNYDKKNFSDSLVADSFVDFPRRISNLFDVIFSFLSKSVQQGYLHWIVSAAVGLTLWACYGFVLISSWKLIDFLFIFCSSVFVLIINYLYHIDFFKGLNNLISFSKFGISSFEFMSGFLNLFIFLIFIISGIIIYILKGRKK